MPWRRPVHNDRINRDALAIGAAWLALAGVILYAVASLFL
jgi:hypothetical protein